VGWARRTGPAHGQQGCAWRRPSCIGRDAGDPGHCGVRPKARASPPTSPNTHTPLCRGCRRRSPSGDRARSSRPGRCPASDSKGRAGGTGGDAGCQGTKVAGMAVLISLPAAGQVRAACAHTSRAKRQHPRRPTRTHPGTHLQGTDAVVGAVATVVVVVLAADHGVARVLRRKRSTRVGPSGVARAQRLHFRARAAAGRSSSTPSSQSTHARLPRVYGEPGRRVLHCTPTRVHGLPSPQTSSGPGTHSPAWQVSCMATNDTSREGGWGYSAGADGPWPDACPCCAAHAPCAGRPHSALHACSPRWCTCLRRCR
jgi:hypothetical protein